MMEDNRKVLDRDALYKEVWHTPITRLPPKYNISDVGLKKICKALNIPTPPRGYWAKVQNNIRVDKTPLPKLKIGQPRTYTIQKYDIPNNQPEEEENTLSSEALQFISQLKSGKPFKVPARLISPHPLVIETREAFSDLKTNRYGIQVGNWEKRYLDIRVSPGMFKRALRIFDFIIKFFESEGIKVSVGNSYSGNNTSIKIFNENISFYIREPSIQRRHKLTEEDKRELKRWPHALIQKYDYTPSGKLSLEIDPYCGRGIRKKWGDGKQNRLEDYIEDFITSLIEIADI